MKPTTRMRVRRPRSFLFMRLLFHCSDFADSEQQDILLAELGAVEETGNRALMHHRDPVGRPDDLLHIA